LNFFFSLSDLTKLLKQNRLLFGMIFLICSCLGFCYKLTRPLQYTAQGLFKGHVSNNNSRILKALEFLGTDDTYLSADDPRYNLRSYPVIEGVVKSLNLQSYLVETGANGKIKEIWHTLKTAAAYRSLKTNPHPSAILDAKVYVPNRQIIPDYHPSAVCTHLEYIKDTSSTLSIHFLNDTQFQVKEGSSVLGKSALNLPFEWLGGSFTLTGKGYKGKILTLHLIPLPQAIQSLQNTLKITRDKENPVTILIKYTHRDRLLASCIVNETMQQYQAYLHTEAKKKITKQLAYLRSRQEENMDQFESILAEQKKYLSSHLDAGAILSSEKELEFMAQTQAQIKSRLLDIQSELEYLSEIDTDDENIPPGSSHSFSVESAHQMIHEHQKELDRIHLDLVRYDYCLEQLNREDFDCSSLSKIIDDNTLQDRFIKLHTLHHRLIDTKNWSPKEREQLHTELEVEKAFLKEHTNQLKVGAELHAKATKKRITILQKDLGLLLVDRYNQEQKSLATLSENLKGFPEKWVYEQKLNLSTKMYKEMMEAISKMIEAKNFGYHLDYLLANVLKPAHAPLLPEPPRLLLWAALSGFSGSMCLLLGLLFYGVWKGPSATFTNLSFYGKRVINPSETIPLLGLELSDQEKIILCASKNETGYAFALAEWLGQKGEKVQILDLRKKDEAYLVSRTFRDRLIQDQFSLDRILLVANGQTTGFTIQALLKYADAVIYETVCGDFIENLSALPPKTIFIFKDENSLKSLGDIAPQLDQLYKRIKHSSFSVLTRVWQQAFPLKKS